MHARSRPGPPFRGAILFVVLLLAVSAAAAFDAAVVQAPVPRAAGPAAQTPGGAAAQGALRVIDGDTLELDGERIRLFGVDAPEGGQVCASGEPGPLATAALEALTRGRGLRCEGRDRDRYGRRIAVCRAGGEDLGAALVRAGLAWNYARYAGDRYTAEERAARDSRRGIWAMGCDEPWVWRRRATQSAR